MSSDDSIANLLIDYRQAAGRTADLSDSTQQNKAADRLHACYKKLQETAEGRSGIISLMSDLSPYVRVWAAAHSLQWVPDQARRVLEALRDENTFPYSFDAKMTLQEYDKGRLTFDY